MSIKLRGSSAGSVSWDAPSDTSPSGTDVTLTLPTSAGSAGQYLRNSGTPGTLEFGTIPGSFTSYAIICDQKTNGTAGGTFTSGAYRTRDLNTELTDEGGIVSISSNQFTLQAGNYLVKWSCPAYRADAHRSALYDVTNTSYIEYSMTSYANNTYNGWSSAIGSTRISITGATTYEIRHRCTGGSGSSFGAGFSSLGDSETYTIVEIYKEA